MYLLNINRTSPEYFKSEWSSSSHIAHAHGAALGAVITVAIAEKNVPTVLNQPMGI